ncbi:SIMPL domain-containing protein [Rhodococcus sp. NPDC058505]|uniref:SIMPL domain-containing protein n=1 Tax=unclassified Rhodococcus (in: high G+C Gram-positive bacteria) TaxID=192944 RepID=UPI00364C3F65
MSSPTVSITVTGHAERRFTPNRCTVTLRVHADGATREAAAGQAAAAIAAVTDLITALRDDGGPVRRWSLDQVQHTRTRPYHPEGTQQPWLYQSSAPITVTFTDFRAVGPFVTRAAEVDAASVEHLRWWMSRGKEAKRVAAVRRLAVADAIEKAQIYTESLGLGAFHAAAIADTGMLGVPTPPGPLARGAMRAAAPMAAMATDAGGPALVLEPGQVTISADVEARFEAS